MTRLLLVGCGNWGTKLAERFAAMGNRIFAYDVDLEKRESLTQKVGIVAGAQLPFDDYLVHAEACIVATPPATHYEIAKRCLEADKHVLVEKPMTLNWDEAKSLVSLARKKQLTLMTDDTFLYVDWAMPSHRVDTFEAHWTGPRRPDPSTPEEGILWDLGPHPVSLMLKIMGRLPVGVEGMVKPRLADLRYSFAGHDEARILLNWDTPVRERSLYLRDDSGPSHINFDAISPTGDDPLTHMCRAFIDRVSAPPWIDTHALEVVEILAMAESLCKSS